MNLDKLIPVSFSEQLHVKQLLCEDKYDCENFDNVYRTAVSDVKDIYKERLANKMSTIINFIDIVEKIYTNDDATSLVQLMQDKKLWINAKNAANDILNIENC